MSRTFRSRFAAVGVAVALCSAAALAENTVRPDVGKPLKAAEALMKSGKARDALAKIGEAEAVPNRTPYENLLIQEMRGSASNAAGDFSGANKAFEGVIASGQLPARDQLTLVQAVAVNYYRLKEYVRKASDAKMDWIFRALKAMQVESIPCTRVMQEVFTPHSKRAAQFVRLLTG